MNTALSQLPRTWRVVAFGLLLCGLCHPLRAQQQRIATVDFLQAFNGYWKVKEANTRLSNDAREDTETMNNLFATYKKTGEEYKALTNSAAEPALSSEERSKRQAAATDKFKEVQSLEISLKQINDQFVAKADEKKRRYRAEFVSDIANVVTTLAKAGNFAFVIDVSADSGNNQMPIIIFSSGENDLTAQVLAQLNKDAPKEPAPAAVPTGATSSRPALSVAPQPERTNAATPNFPRSITPTNSATKAAPAAGSR